MFSKNSLRRRVDSKTETYLNHVVQILLIVLTKHFSLVRLGWFLFARLSSKKTTRDKPGFKSPPVWRRFFNFLFCSVQKINKHFQLKETKVAPLQEFRTNLDTFNIRMLILGDNFNLHSIGYVTNRRRRLLSSLNLHNSKKQYRPSWTNNGDSRENTKYMHKLRMGRSYKVIC